MRATDTGKGEGVCCLLVQAGDYLCALPLHQVRRVVRSLITYPLPGASVEMIGLAEFNGEPLPVLDLGRLIGSPPGATPSHPVTIVAWAGPPNNHELVGLSADAAVDIAEITLADIVPTQGGAVWGETTIDQKPIRVVNLERLAGE